MFTPNARLVSAAAAVLLASAGLVACNDTDAPESSTMSPQSSTSDSMMSSEMMEPSDSMMSSEAMEPSDAMMSSEAMEPAAPSK
ncbi:hypothetical protein [Corynebacterium timonense]|uniref:Uncharacterized protein n=1 Tax=Corynebacterium timonense TaxID=441500 RepID=A0A1H1SVL2_9CORY|nr:hypothetical protein [Corynebacterium timonense]SDS51888.1 hypothetical protein SAMN04488539_1832 [Corynebacterium timonense]